MTLVTISKKNTKLGRIPNVSLVPVKDCRNCTLCKKDCYALKAFRMYPNVRAAWEGNSFLANDKRADYFLQIQNYLLWKRPAHFRWHVAGDILDQDYLNWMMAVALNVPITKFLVFTKMHYLDYSKCPRNLEVVFSRWPGDHAVKPPKGIRQAWMQDGKETRIPKDAIECSGKCDECTLCWELSGSGKDVFFHLH